MVERGVARTGEFGRAGATRRGFLVAAGAGVCLAGATLSWRRGWPGTPDVPHISAPEAHRRTAEGRLTLVDIRTPAEWAASGVPEGAVTLDMRRDDFAAVLSDILFGDRAAPAALICARGVRSARMTARMTEAGFARTVDVAEGMLGSAAGPGWIARGLPVVRL